MQLYVCRWPAATCVGGSVSSLSYVKAKQICYGNGYLLTIRKKTTEVWFTHIDQSDTNHIALPAHFKTRPIITECLNSQEDQTR